MSLESTGDRLKELLHVKSDSPITVVFYTVYTQMIEVFSSITEAHTFIDATAKHFTMVEIYAGEMLIDTLRLV